MVSDMAAVETALGADADKVGFVFLSIDPVRDVPAKTKTWADKLKLDSSRWDVLTGDKDAVRELAVILNYKYEQIDEAFMHSNVIFVMDAQGRIAHRADGFGADIPALTKAVQETLEKTR
jgi:protein SCO1